MAAHVLRMDGMLSSCATSSLPCTVTSCGQAAMDLFLQCPISAAGTLSRRQREWLLPIPFNMYFFFMDGFVAAAGVAYCYDLFLLTYMCSVNTYVSVVFYILVCAVVSVPRGTAVPAVRRPRQRCLVHLDTHVPLARVTLVCCALLASTASQAQLSAQTVPVAL
jgi:hypothetical protein